VVFTPELRLLTESSIHELRNLMESETIPAAIFKPACEACSLFEVCLPKITANPDAMAAASEALFRV
jgi:CRISPR/Cas system-associated exonuclease Cas4 (RecB family)